MPDNENVSVLDETESKPVPPELAGSKKGGKGPCPECGSTRRHKSGCSHAGEAGTKPKATTVNITDDAVARAWLGAWVLFGLAVWLFGRWFVKPDEKVSLGDLTEDEARNDARLLLPLFVKYPSLFTVLAWIGTPIAIARRVSGKIHVAKVEKKDKADKDATIRAVP